jgi:histidine triad (HIT) family protein
MCIFCKIVKGEAPSWKVYENEKVYAFLDINPVSRYHTLVIPKTHYENIFDISDEDLQAVISVVGKLSKLYQQKLNINHIQVVNSNGKEAQQDVFHIHYHIVPRKFSDGQSIRWKTFPEWRTEFDGMLDKLKD